MDRNELRTLLLSTAEKAVGNGPGWAQEGVVLREAGEHVSRKLNGRVELKDEQALIESWQDLFTEKVLAWGFNLENPGFPFFHIRQPG